MNKVYQVILTIQNNIFLKGIYTTRELGEKRKEQVKDEMKRQHKRDYSIIVHETIVHNEVPE